MPKLRYLQALNAALGDEMRRDPSVFVLGEDVRQSLRGVTKGLVGEFGPSRVIDTPLSEQAFTGFATGAALMGMRPVVEYQIPSLLFLVFEQIVNQAQKFRLMTGGQASVPVTYIVPGSGARRGLAAQHSDHPYSFFIHAGVKTVVPSTADDAYGLLISSIRDDDPVVFFAPAAVLGRRDEVMDSHVVPLGQARIHREGRDVTLVAVGHLVHDGLRVAEALEAEGISVEVFDPRTLLPFDHESLATSVRKTGRLVILDDCYHTAGFAAEVAAFAAEHLSDSMRAPIRRVTRADVPIGFALPLELYALPSEARLAAAIRAVARA
jgi:acetoin:2,6-dichlorophenolindophenol oxidoreductase subunit beta